MRALILLHSSTGNTRVVTRFAARHLEAQGVHCVIHDIGKADGPPPLDGEVDLLGVAFPVMYFQPTLAMEQVVANLKSTRPDLPAFVLATAAGDPGAALQMACEQLTAGGFLPVDAHWVIAPSNLPQQLALVHKTQSLPGGGLFYKVSSPLARAVYERLPALRPLASMVWPDASTPLDVDRRKLERFLAGVLDRVAAVRAGERMEPPDLSQKTSGSGVWAGMHLPVEVPIQMIGLKFDHAICNQCKACSVTCPVDAITVDERGLPRLGPGCTGCYACYNHCLHGAITAVWTPPKIGRYAGPSRRMRRVFWNKDQKSPSGSSKR